MRKRDPAYAKVVELMGYNAVDVAYVGDSLAELPDALASLP